jgi:tRNA 2-thiocytidine biosynthesis protein TtcA
VSERFFRNSGPLVIVEKMVLKAVMEACLIEPGDRVLLAASGGKDSTTLGWALSRIRPAVEKETGGSYTVEALHISSDFCSCCKKAALRLNLAAWGIAFNDLDVPVIGRLKPGRKMNCYWCSTQRRTELLRYATAHNFNKIALGHHLDDIVETLFMNMFNKGEFSTMPLRLDYQKYPVSIIRPLAYLEEKQIIEAAEKLGILAASCTCPYGANSARRVMRKKIAEFTGGDGAVKRRILRAAQYTMPIHVHEQVQPANQNQQSP